MICSKTMTMSKMSTITSRRIRKAVKKRQDIRVEEETQKGVRIFESLFEQTYTYMIFLDSISRVDDERKENRNHGRNI